jgi:hypothetical protein
MRWPEFKPRDDWFIPHPTTITLPDGSELDVDCIPYEGWGTTPGKGYRITEHDDDGNIISNRFWFIPLEET